MGLAMNKEVENSGVVASYWRVIQIEVDLINNTNRVVVAGYASKALRDAGKAPLSRHCISLKDAKVILKKEELSGNDPMSVLYQGLKSDPFFQGATDQ